MENRYTEGIAFDGAAILDNGKPITIDEILKRLNEHDKLVNKTNDIHNVSCCEHHNVYVVDQYHRKCRDCGKELYNKDYS